LLQQAHGRKSEEFPGSSSKESSSFGVYLKKLFNLINIFSNVAGHKMNTQNAVAFQCTKNEQSENEIRKTIAFAIISKKLIYLEIN
jgi:hypothetical protein